MDPVRNPYTPNAGVMPHELVGRDDVLAAYRTVVQRATQGRPDKGFIVTGLRGVGKTVLLVRMNEIGLEEDVVVVRYEAPRTPGAFTRQFSSLARRALLDLAPAKKWGERARRAAGVLQGFKAQFDPHGTWTFGIDVAPVEGAGDSGDLLSDLPQLVVAVGEAAAEARRAVVFLVDEIQYLSTDELSALVMGKHAVNQRRLPVVLAGAGLPQLPSLTGEAQTYAERMFTWPRIGPLATEDALRVLINPASDEGVQYEDAAAHFIVEYTEGYPFFLQEYGKAAWDLAPTEIIDLATARAAQPIVEETLDQDFFALRTGSLPDKELEYVKALASLGPGEHRPGEVARVMGYKSSSSTGALAARLTGRGLIYSSKRGWLAFTVPQFDRYVARAF